MDIFTIIVITGLVLLIPTAYAAKIGAPYAPTFKAAITQAFTYINLNNKDILVDLGAGDGRVLLEANKRGAKTIGYELSPIMATVISLRSLTKKNIKIKMSNFYKQTLPTETTVIFIFLLPATMYKAKNLLARQKLPNLKYVLVYAFPFKDIAPLHVIHAPKCARLYIYDTQDLIR